VLLTKLCVLVPQREEPASFVVSLRNSANAADSNFQAALYGRGLDHPSMLPSLGGFRSRAAVMTFRAAQALSVVGEPCARRTRLAPVRAVEELGSGGIVGVTVDGEPAIAAVLDAWYRRLSEPPGVAIAFSAAAALERQRG
jgi:hypothetical protein